MPIHKSGDTASVNNYRPISILPAFSKVYEKLVYKRLYRFLENNAVLSDEQFGFRSGMSTESAMLTFSQDIIRSFEENLYVVAVFIDLKKAFDILSCLSANFTIGIHVTANSWFKETVSSMKEPRLRRNNPYHTPCYYRHYVDMASFYGGSVVGSPT